MRNSAPLDYVLQELDKLNKQITKLEEDYKVMKAKFDKNENVMPVEKEAFTSGKEAEVPASGAVMEAQ